MPKEPYKGYELPEVLTGHALRQVCFDIPDVAEYRRAFWDKVYELTQYWRWEKTSYADMRNKTAAEYWETILYSNLVRFGEDEDCTPDDTCRAYPPTAPFIQWFPNDPVYSPDLVGDGYNAPAWYFATPASNIAYGSQTGDVITSIDRFPPGSLPTIIPASGLPRFRINVTGEGTVKAKLVNMFAGSLIQTTVDDDIGTLNFIDVSRDTISAPPETNGEITVEFTFTTPGAHFIDFIVISWVNATLPFLHHGGGLRSVELCGFITMPISSPPFRFTEECGLEYYNGEAWIPVEGWTEFAPTCFTGPAGATGATGAAGADGADGADGHGIYIHETTTGLMQSDNPSFTPETLIYAYYRADATRPAEGFYGRSTLPYLRLYDNVPALRLALQVVGAAQNELDTRESRLLMRFGSGAFNGRQMYFNDNGTVQLVNSVVTPTSKFEVFNDVSANNAVKFEGRSGQATGTAVLHLGVVNQEAAGSDGYAILARGLNSGTATRAPGIFTIDKHGRSTVSDSEKIQVLSTGTTPQQYRLASEKQATLHDMSSANYRSRVQEFAYKNAVAYETMRHEVTADDEAAFAVLGQTASPRVDVGVLDCGGNDAAYAALSALVTFGFIEGTITLGEPPAPETPAPQFDRCQIASRAARWIMDVYLQIATDIIILPGFFADAIEVTFLRSGTYAPDLLLLSAFAEDLDTEYHGGDPESDHVPQVAAYFEDFRNALYCALDDDGCFNAGSKGILIALTESANVDVQFFQQWLNAFEQPGFAQMVSAALVSNCDMLFDCTEYDCDTWTVFMNFAADEWDASVELISGDYDESGYFVCDVGEAIIEIPFDIFSAQVHWTTDGVGTQIDELRIVDINTSVSTSYTPSAGIDSITWTGHAVDGIRVHIVAPAATCAYIQSLTLQGMGVEPAP